MLSCNPRARMPEKAVLSERALDISGGVVATLDDMVLEPWPICLLPGNGQVPERGAKDSYTLLVAVLIDLAAKTGVVICRRGTSYKLGIAMRYLL